MKAHRPTPISLDEQLKVFKSLGYDFADGVTQEMIFREVNEINWDSDITAKDFLEQEPFSWLYFFYGHFDPALEGNFYSSQCIWYDLEFFDPAQTAYGTFMYRMGLITHGEIAFTDIKVHLDDANWEWISFKVNGIAKRWKLEKRGYIADHYIQRFAYLPTEFNTKGRYTYYDNGGQQFVLDYATEEEQNSFIQKTGLRREWLDKGDFFSEPPVEP